MTHEELLAEIIGEGDGEIVKSTRRWHNTKALRAVVELHKPRFPDVDSSCQWCEDIYRDYPCPTIQAIEKELV